MFIEAHNRLRDPLTAEVTRVVIYDDNDNPIALALQLSGGQYHVARLGDPEFKLLLQRLGVNSVVEVRTVHAS